MYSENVPINNLQKTSEIKITGLRTLGGGRFIIGKNRRNEDTNYIKMINVTTAT